MMNSRIQTLPCNRRRAVAAVLTGAAMVGLMVTGLAAPNQAAPESPDTASTERIHPPSPIHQFRGLLVMDEESREKFLASRRPDQVGVLRRKIAEYVAMPRPERELRFRQLELCRWMLPLMRVNEDAREDGLSRIPMRDRTVVEERLREWDRLTASQKENVLRDKTVLSYFFRPEPAFIKRQMDLMSIMPPELRVKLESELAQWRGRSVAERERMQIRLNQLLKLKQAERERLLTGATPSENAQLRAILGLFLELTLEQRQHCIEGFSKLANLPPAERERFIFDAARWRAMSDEQRNLWRVMILRIRTPLDSPPSPMDAARSTAPLDSNLLATNE